MLRSSSELGSAFSALAAVEEAKTVARAKRLMKQHPRFWLERNTGWPLYAWPLYAWPLYACSFVALCGKTPWNRHPACQSVSKPKRWRLSHPTRTIRNSDRLAQQDINLAFQT